MGNLFIVCHDCLTYGSECWAMKVTNKRNIPAKEMRMLREILGVSRRDHAKRGNPTHSTRFTDRRDSSLVWTRPETICKQRHSQNDEPGNTRYQTTRTSQQDMAPTNEGRQDGRGCYPGCGPRPEGVEKKDKADP